MSRILNFRVHYTWIFVTALVTYTVTTQFPENYPLLTRVLLGIATSLLFLASVAIRELVFITAGFRKDMPLKNTTLFVFGAVFPEHKNEVAIAHWRLQYLAKFLVNLIMAAIFYGLYATFIVAGNLMVAGVAQWLAYICLLLFLIHFIPAFPLEGGQILRLVIWKSSGDYYKSTHTASLIGWIFGFFLIFAGVMVLIITQEWTISFLIIILGWIIEIAAGQARQAIKNYILLQNIMAKDIMTVEYPAVPPQASIEQLVREHILIKGWRYILVVEGKKLKGIVTLKQIKSVPWNHWKDTVIGDIMIPYNQIITSHLQQTADILFGEMYRRGVDYIPVLEDENVVGVVNRADLTGLINTRIGFGA